MAEFKPKAAQWMKEKIASLEKENKAIRKELSESKKAPPAKEKKPKEEKEEEAEEKPKKKGFLSFLD